MNDFDYWREELMKAISVEDFTKAGRQVFVRMRDEGMSWQTAAELVNRVLGEGEGLTEDENDRLTELSQVPYGHCAPTWRVWN